MRSLRELQKCVKKVPITFLCGGGGGGGVGGGGLEKLSPTDS
jgi:hypothetical protein